MSDDDTLTKALSDVRERKAALQSDYDRIAEELSKLRAAETALTAIVEGTPLRDLMINHPSDKRTQPGGDRLSSGHGGGRGSRGPRASSAKGRLKVLLESTGPTGLSHAEIARQLTDVAPNTLNTYLSMMVTNGEAIRRGDFFSFAASRDEENTDDAGPDQTMDASIGKDETRDTAAVV